MVPAKLRHEKSLFKIQNLLSILLAKYAKVERICEQNARQINVEKFHFNALFHIFIFPGL